MKLFNQHVHIPQQNNICFKRGFCLKTKFEIFTFVQRNAAVMNWRKSFKLFLKMYAMMEKDD